MMGKHTCGVWRSEENFMQTVLSFYLHMSSGNQTQVTRHMWQVATPTVALAY